jgi:CRP-like cAMP-binding protein
MVLSLSGSSENQFRHLGFGHMGSLVRSERLPSSEGNMRAHPNEMLASLSFAEFEELRPYLTTMGLARGAVLVEAGELPRRVYFPHSGVVSLVVRLSDGHMIETGMVGRESLVGGSAGLHAAIAPNTAVVQIAGIGSVLDAAHLYRLADVSTSMRAILARHETSILLQAQAAACNAVHPLQARLATWLLRCRDLAGTDRLDFTQEYVATMFGVRRTSVTLIATALQKRGLIS